MIQNQLEICNRDMRIRGERGGRGAGGFFHYSNTLNSFFFLFFVPNFHLDLILHAFLNVVEFKLLGICGLFI